MKVLVFISLLLVFLVGCLSVRPGYNSARKTTGPYNFVIAWDNYIYGLTDKVIQADQLGSKIGDTERTVSPSPERNGDVATAISDCKDVIPVGSELRLIKNVDQRKAIAVEVPPVGFQKAVKVGRLTGNR